MSDPYGRPPLPPPEKDAGQPVARFVGWVDSYGSTTKGFDYIKIAVERTERYKMLRLTDEQGIQLRFTVHKPEMLTLDIDEDGDAGGLDDALLLALVPPPDSPADDSPDVRP